MTSDFATPFKPQAKSQAPKLSQELLPPDLTNASHGISEREFATEDGDAVCKKITHRKTSDDPLVPASLMTTGTDPANALINSAPGRTTQVLHLIHELLRTANPLPLFQHFNTHDGTSGNWFPRSVDVAICNLTHEDFAHRSITCLDENGIETLLPFCAQSRLKTVACFCWHLICSCDYRQGSVNLAVFRRHQFEDFWIIDLRLTLRCLGVPVCRSVMFADDESIVTSSTIPQPQGLVGPPRRRGSMQEWQWDAMRMQ